MEHLASPGEGWKVLEGFLEEAGLEETLEGVPGRGSKESLRVGSKQGTRGACPRGESGTWVRNKTAQGHVALCRC